MKKKVYRAKRAVKVEPVVIEETKKTKKTKKVK